MATLKCGMYSFIFNYEEFCDKYGYDDYTYSLRIMMMGSPMFSDAIAKEHLAPGERFIFTSDEGDHLLEAFKSFVDKTSPLDQEIAYYSEVDGPQQVFIKLLKTVPPRYKDLVWYYITIELESDSFVKCCGVGDLRLTTHTIYPKDVQAFIAELEKEREQIWLRDKTRK